MLVQVAIVGSGLAGLTAAVDLVDAGHEVDLYEARPFMGGKVGSWVCLLYTSDAADE